MWIINYRYTTDILRLKWASNQENIGEGQEVGIQDDKGEKS